MLDGETPPLPAQIDKKKYLDNAKAVNDHDVTVQGAKKKYLDNAKAVYAHDVTVPNALKDSAKNVGVGEVGIKDVPAKPVQKDLAEDRGVFASYPGSVDILNPAKMVERWQGKSKDVPANVKDSIATPLPTTTPSTTK